MDGPRPEGPGSARAQGAAVHIDVAAERVVHRQQVQGARAAQHEVAVALEAAGDAEGRAGADVDTTRLTGETRRVVGEVRVEAGRRLQGAAVEADPARRVTHIGGRGHRDRARVDEEVQESGVGPGQGDRSRAVEARDLEIGDRAAAGAVARALKIDCVARARAAVQGEATGRRRVQIDAIDARTADIGAVERAVEIALVCARRGGRVDVAGDRRTVHEVQDGRVGAEQPDGVATGSGARDDAAGVVIDLD